MIDKSLTCEEVSKGFNRSTQNTTVFCVERLFLRYFIQLPSFELSGTQESVRWFKMDKMGGGAVIMCCSSWLRF